MTLHINGRAHAVEGDLDRPLLGVLRDELGLTGAKYGCGEGQCGACTVLVDGAARRSCTLPVGEVGEAAVTTIEGLATGDRLHPVQAAFVAEEALQCGYCTPGMILAAAALLRREPNPTREAVIAALNGNVCRCGAHPRILAAVDAAAAALREAAR